MLAGNAKGEPLPVELPEDEHALFAIGLVDHRPLQADGEGMNSLIG